MKKPRSSILIFLHITLVLLLALPTIAFAESENTLSKNKAEWNLLSENQKNQLRENLKEWNTIPKEQQAQIKERFSEFKKLSKEKKEKIRIAYLRYKQLSPERQLIVKKRLDSLNHLSQQDHEKKINRIRELLQEKGKDSLSEKQDDNLINPHNNDHQDDKHHERSNERRDERRDERKNDRKENKTDNHPKH